jgi:hypothetical protein
MIAFLILFIHVMISPFKTKARPEAEIIMLRQLARSEYVHRRENVIALGNSGTGKSHVALGLGLAACQKGDLANVGTGLAIGLVAQVLAPLGIVEIAIQPRASFGDDGLGVPAADQDGAVAHREQGLAVGRESQ